MNKILNARSLLLASFFALALAWAPEQASADYGKGSFRLGGDVGVFALQHWPNAGGRSYTDTQVGVYPGGLGVNIGFQIADSIVIGGRVGFGHNDNSFFGNGASSFLNVAPFFEFLFSNGDIQPFIGAQAVFGAVFPGGNPTSVFFEPDALGGIHIFLEKSFSISPTAFVGFRYHDTGTPAGAYGAFSTGIMVSLNGWIS